MLHSTSTAVKTAISLNRKLLSRSFLSHKKLLSKQCCGIAECLRSFPSTFECPNIPVVRWLLTYSKPGNIFLKSWKSNSWHVVHVYMCEGGSSYMYMHVCVCGVREGGGGGGSSREQEMRGGSTNLFTLCKVYLVSVPHYWHTLSDIVCQLVK